MREARVKLEEYVVRAVKHVEKRKSATPEGVIEYIKKNYITERSPVKRIHRVTVEKILECVEMEGIKAMKKKGKAKRDAHKNGSPDKKDMKKKEENSRPPPKCGKRGKVLTYRDRSTRMRRVTEEIKGDVKQMMRSRFRM